MKLCLLFLACSVSFPAFSQTQVSALPSVIGRVTFQGVPPPEIVIKEMGPDCAALQTNMPITRHYVVSTNGGLANVLVVIRAEFDAKQLPPISTNAVVMDCNFCQLHPYVIAARTGQPVRFQNYSGMNENLHVTPRINREWNFAFTSGFTRTVTFDAPEDFIRVKGDVHPWFFGYVCVVGHPFFAVTGPDGNFALPTGLPDGAYTLEAVHMKSGAQRQTITVKQGRAAPVEFIYKASELKKAR
jgi:hypothetical protein